MSGKKNVLINYFLLIIIVFLILVILQLLFKNDKELKPTGNVEIFDIICDYNCDCDKENDEEPVFGESDFSEGFNVFDSNVSWKLAKDLNIFANPMYEMDNKISPESTNFYQFIVRNNTIYNVKYDVKFDETNPYKINMKYRLMKNNEYIAGDENIWVSFVDLNFENVSLATKMSDTYYLEWKWFSSENDTEIGQNGNANYSLAIEIKAVDNK